MHKQAYQEPVSGESTMGEQHASSSVFLSYSHSDDDFVMRLKADLQAQGIPVWRDREGVQPGTPDWEEALREAIRSASAIVLIASPSARTSRYVKDELRIAEMYQRPVYPVWATGTRWMDVIPIGWGGTQYIDAREACYETALPELVTVLRTLSPTPTPTAVPLTPSSLPVLNFEPRNPYKGLRPFTGEDARDFFGRDALVRDLLEKIKATLAAEAQDVQGARLLAVVGPSGSGKSSVVMAGLLPVLQQNALPESSGWTYLPPFVPGAHPIEALTLILTEVFPERSLKSIREDLDDDASRGLHLLATALIKRQRTRVVLVVDQFEELFTQTTNEHERQHFIDLLMTAITEPQGPVIVILTLRADFYDRPMRYPLLYQHLQERLVAVLPMTLSGLRAAIENPVAQSDVQLVFEALLVGDMLFDIQGQPGMLPLLQFTLAQLFERRNGLLLTLQAYHDMGGVKGALAKHAESTYTSLPTDEHRRMARGLFLRLINPGTTEQDMTRQRAALSELDLPDAKQKVMMDTVVNTFTTARLLTTNTVAGIPTIEVSHEALIGAWSRLTTWVHESYEDMRLQKALSEDVAEWKRRGEPADRLYRGSQLTEAQAWRERNLPSSDEDAFLHASATDEKEALAQAKQQQTRYTRRMVLVGAAGLGLAGLASGYLLFLRPPQVVPVTFPYGYQSQNPSVTWSPDGKWFALQGYDGTVQVWDATNGTHLFTYKSDNYNNRVDVTWSPDGKRLALQGYDGTVQVWDTTNGTHLFTYKSDNYNNRVDVAWSPDGKRLASFGSDNTVRVWDADTGTSLLNYKGHTDVVNVVVWSPDGKRLASSGYDGMVQVWDATNGTHLFTYKGHGDVGYTLVWSPDGKWVALWGNDGTVQVWGANTGTHLFTYKSHSGQVNTVSWSPDGKRLALGGGDKTVQVWDANTGSPLFTYKGHTDAVNDAEWSPDGKRLASADNDKTVQVWDANTGTSLLTYRGHIDAVNAVAW
ncbi:MAG: TIR domain-containing protein, partial [Chloroflexi bacterium]|nr:TIR domain-containing protein [Chloroflexota bacterium]